MTRITDQSTRRASTLQCRFRAAAIVGLVTATLMSPTAASAGACKHTQRITERVSTDGIPVMTVETVVRDDAKYKNYDVVIKRNGNEVKTGTVLVRGSSKQISNSAASGKKSTFDVEISVAGDEETASTCSYVVSIGSKGLDSTTTWQLSEGADAVCGGAINVSCDKSYRSGSWSWKTTLVITD